MTAARATAATATATVVAAARSQHTCTCRRYPDPVVGLWRQRPTPLAAATAAALGGKVQLLQNPAAAAAVPAAVPVAVPKAISAGWYQGGLCGKLRERGGRQGR